ncbi:heparin-binding hemagglutinin [Nocardia callitridis]|uniref:Heparin-binding hemagglutinin n=1 Tax=Nocardia callitridis TaxID=648753 RepID=A0ABP9K1L7_9NOCA
MTEKNPTVTRSLLATVGAGDALYAAVTDVVTQVRERASTTDVSGKVEEARERFATVPADVQAQFESLRERLSELPSELPEDLAELREKFTPEELRALAEKYYRQALDAYTDLADRGEETVDRLRNNHLVEDRIERVEVLYTDAVSRFNGLLGRPGKAESSNGDSDEVVDAEVVTVTTEAEPVAEPQAPSEPVATGGATAAPKKAPAAKRAAAKKTAPKKAAPKQV